MKNGKKEDIAVARAGLVSMAVTRALMVGLAWLPLALGAQLLAPAAFAQTKPAVELEGAIAREQVDGDLKSAIAAYQRISADTSASRDTRAKALLHLAGCYEKLGQQAQKVYAQIVREFPDQPAAKQARARLAWYSTRQVPALKELKPERLTSNTPELTIPVAAISPDGKSIAYSDPLGVHVRSVATGATRLLPGTQDHTLVHWMPDGNSVQTQLQDTAGGAAAMVVSLQGGRPTPALSDPFVASPDRIHRASVSADHRQISIQDATTGNSRVLWSAAAERTLDQFQWSPNGKQIAVSSSVKAENGNQSAFIVELIEIAGGRKQVLVPAEKKLDIGSMVWASQNRMILAIDEELGINAYNSNLWELRLNDSGALVAGGLRKLTSWTDFPIRSESLSTDGKRLVFIRSFRQRDVYVASLGAGGTRMGTPQRLTLDLGDDYPSDWTRDSKTVILTSSRNGPHAIFRQDLDKQTANQIVVMPQKSDNQRLARVTPDGGSVLFLNWDPVKRIGRLMRAPIGGGTPEAVPNAENVGFYYRCAPAGVCVMAQPEGQGFIISEFDPVKGKGREIYRDSHVERLLPSPDGKWIADTSGSGSGSKIVLRSFSTGAVVREVPVRGVTKLTSLDYAPDGKGFFAGDTSQTEARELYIDPAGNTSVLWRQPGIGSWIWGIPSPDGKYLALVMVTDDSNVYMVENF